MGEKITNRKEKKKQRGNSGEIESMGRKRGFLGKKCCGSDSASGFLLRIQSRIDIIS
jgi:hypothetical protein